MFGIKIKVKCPSCGNVEVHDFGITPTYKKDSQIYLPCNCINCASELMVNNQSSGDCNEGILMRYNIKNELVSKLYSIVDMLKMRSNKQDAVEIANELAISSDYKDVSREDLIELVEIGQILAEDNVETALKMDDTFIQHGAICY